MLLMGKAGENTFPRGRGESDSVRAGEANL